MPPRAKSGAKTAAAAAVGEHPPAHEEEDALDGEQQQGEDDVEQPQVEEEQEEVQQEELDIRALQVIVARQQETLHRQSAAFEEQQAALLHLARQLRQQPHPLEKGFDLRIHGQAFPKTIKKFPVLADTLPNTAPFSAAWHEPDFNPTYLALCRAQNIGDKAERKQRFAEALAAYGYGVRLHAHFEYVLDAWKDGDIDGDGVFAGIEAGMAELATILQALHIPRINEGKALVCIKQGAPVEEQAADIITSARNAYFVSSLPDDVQKKRMATDAEYSRAYIKRIAEAEAANRLAARRGGGFGGGDANAGRGRGRGATRGRGGGGATGALPSSRA